MSKLIITFGLIVCIWLLALSIITCLVAYYYNSLPPFEATYTVTSNNTLFTQTNLNQNTTFYIE